MSSAPFPFLSPFPFGGYGYGYDYDTSLNLRLQGKMAKGVEVEEAAGMVYALDSAFDFVLVSILGPGASAKGRGGIR